jgi:3',5'-cyclic AMP phosphodiesterase CpdA
LIIAQISDLHVRPRGRRAYGDVDTNAMAARAVAAVAGLVPAPDCVVVTGDLTDCGLEEEYVVLDELLRELTAPVFVIPGNHDRRAALLRVLGPRHVYLPQDGSFLQYVIGDFPVRLVGVDTVVPGETHGDLCEARLRWLEATLRDGRHRPTLIMMHHPPFLTGVEAMDALRCRAGDPLAALVARHPEIERVICGHYHRPITVRWAGTVGFATPSTAHQVAFDLRPGEPTRFVMEPPQLAVHAWQPQLGMTTHLVPIGTFGKPFDVTLDPDYPGVPPHA